MGDCMRRRIFFRRSRPISSSRSTFVEREIKPHQERWNDEGIVDREAWRKAGQAGLLCTWLPEEVGGPGGDFLHACIVMEELSYAYESGFAVALHSDIVVPYLHEFGSDSQKGKVAAWMCLR